MRYRAKLVALRSGLKAQVHAVMAKEGVLPAVSDMFSMAGNAQLNEMVLGDAYTIRVEPLRDLIEVYDVRSGCSRPRSVSGCAATAGIGRFRRSTGSARPWPRSWSRRSATSTRFRSAAALCSWAGLTPKHKDDTVVHRGQLTKQGSRLVRWAVFEGTVRYHAGGKLAADFRQIAERRGKNTATVAIAPNVLTLVYYACATARSVAWPRPRE